MAPFGAQVSIALAVSWILERVKQGEAISWVRADTQKLNRWIAIIVALASSVGVGFSYHAGTLTITGLTLTSILTYAWHWLEQFVVQEASYQLVVKTPGAKVAAAVKRNG